MNKCRLSKTLINTLALMTISFWLIGCQTHQYPKSSLDVARLTTYYNTDKIFSSPAYPVGSPKDRMNVSFYAKVLEGGEVSYTMWLAFTKKLNLKSIHSEGNIIIWKLSPSDHRITVVEAPNISITKNYIFNFDKGVRNLSIPDWWVQGFLSTFEKVATKEKQIARVRKEHAIEKEKLAAKLKKEAETRRANAKRIEDQWESPRSEYTNKRRKTNEESPSAKEFAWMDKGKQAVKSRLKDPQSAKFQNVYFHRGSMDIPITCGEVNSKNSFGGYTGYQRFVSGGNVELTYLETETADFNSVWQQLCIR